MHKVAGIKLWFAKKNKVGLVSSIRLFNAYFDLEKPSIFHEREVNWCVCASKYNFELSEGVSLNSNVDEH